MAFVVISTSSCEDPRTYDRYQSVSVRGWGKNDTLKFAVPRQWGGKYILDVGVVTAKTFPYRGLSMVINRKIISYPHHKKVEKNFIDTVFCQIIDNNGHILGQDGVSNNTLRSHITTLDLNTSDSVYITVNQNMSMDKLPGVTNIGMRLTKYE